MLSQGGSRTARSSEDAGGEGETQLAHALNDRAVFVAAGDDVVPVHEGDGGDAVASVVPRLVVPPVAAVPGGGNGSAIHVAPVLASVATSLDGHGACREAHALGAARWRDELFFARWRSNNQAPAGLCTLDGEQAEVDVSDTSRLAAAVFVVRLVEERATVHQRGVVLQGASDGESRDDLRAVDGASDLHDARHQQVVCGLV